MKSITEVIEAAGGQPAVDELWSVAYAELKRLAHARLRDAGPVTLLDTTAVVNEAWLRLGPAHLSVEGRGAFLAYAAKVMRSVVLDLVRERLSLRRGGDQLRVTMDTEVAETVSADEPLRVDEALTALAQLEPRLAQVVEMRYFGGLTDAEIAAALDLTDRTVRRDWEKARLLLGKMLS